MRAILADSDRPVLQDIPQPSPGPEQVLVRVRAGALNRIDLSLVKGASHGGLGGSGVPLGVEWAGEVAEVGEAVKEWRVGDRVMAAGLASFAEYTVGQPRMMYAVPDDMSFEQAATLPVSLQTMHDAISTNGRLAPGQTVFIQGASSAMGLMGMQVAKFLGAGKVIGSSTSPERQARLPEYGADAVVDTKKEDWVAQVLEATDGNGVDLLVDLLAGPLVNGSLQATRVDGRMVNVGRMAGESGDFDFDLHSMRRITYVGVTFRTRSAEEVEAVVGKAAQALGPALAKGALNMPVDKVYRLEETSEAYERMARNEHFGKIVLSIP